MQHTSDINYLISDAALAQSQPAKVADTDIADLRMLLQSLIHLEKKIEDAEQTLKKYKNSYNNINQHDIPVLLQQMGVEKIELSINDMTYSVSVKSDLSVTVADKSSLPKLLNKYGASAVLKNTLTLTKLSDDQIHSIAKHIKENFNVDVSVDTTVHPQTLKKLVKELTEGTENQVPVAHVDQLKDVLSVYRYYKTVYKEKRR